MRPAKKTAQRDEENEAFESLIDDEAAAMAQEFIASATSAEFVGEDARNEIHSDELCGPFLEVDLEGMVPYYAEDEEP